MGATVKEIPDTRERLIIVAAEVFTDNGYRLTTVREICSKASANVAAVNYHFGDKKGLYRAVVEYALSCMEKESPLQLPGPDEPPEARLRAFVGAHLACLHSEGQGRLLGLLLANEMREPSPILDEIVREIILPRTMIIRGIIQELLGPEASPDVVQRCHISIVEQVAVYHHSFPILQKVYPHLAYTPETLAGLIDHVTRFSMAGILAMKESQEGPGT